MQGGVVAWAELVWTGEVWNALGVAWPHRPLASSLQQLMPLGEGI